jgi:uncharacterized membrane protein
MALASALCSAGATILIRQGLRGGDPYTGFWINLIVGTVALWSAVMLTGGTGPLTLTGVAFFALAGLIGTMGGRLLRFIAIEKVGASIAAALINLSPLVSAALAVALLGEHVTLPVLVGTVVIVVGTTVLSIGGQRLGARPRHLVLPMLSAACFGVVAVLRKLGLGHVGPVVGFAVNATAALTAFTTFLLVSGQPRDLRGCRGRALACFIAAGVMENAAVFLSVLALSVGTVSVVTPLTGAAPLFVLLLSAVFLRGVETLSGRIVTGTLLIVLGVYLITALSAR